MVRQLCVALISLGLTAAMVATTIAPQSAGFIA
jgi:hypothetical protein